jgi:hypothetical protein
VEAAVVRDEAAGVAEAEADAADKDERSGVVLLRLLSFVSRGEWVESTYVVVWWG